MSDFAGTSASATLSGSAIRFRCMSCGAEFDGNQAIIICSGCGGLLDTMIDTDRTLTPDDFTPTPGTASAISGVWRYRALLPAIPEESIVTRWEGNTPLYEDGRLGDYAGLTGGSIALKHEGHNPTGSFKDRGMTVAVSHARAIGSSVVACASTGNTSASLASYASSAGMASIVLVPDGKISAGKLAQTIAFGATVVQVEGDFDVALRLLRQLTSEEDIYLTNSVNPIRLEGQKSIVFELLAQRDWKAPDVIALPGGNLGNTSAFGKALSEAFQVGLIDRLPRIATIQAEGAAPFAAYYASGFDHYEEIEAETVATAIKIGAPASVPRARRTIEQTSGWVTTVSDQELLDAKAIIDGIGIGCEPASATSLAGVRRLVADGHISPDADVVGILTGNVLKDTEAITAYHLDDGNGQPSAYANRPVRVEATIDALKRVVHDAVQR